MTQDLCWRNVFHAAHATCWVSPKEALQLNHVSTNFIWNSYCCRKVCMDSIGDAENTFWCSILIYCQVCFMRFPRESFIGNINFTLICYKLKWHRCFTSQLIKTWNRLAILFMDMFIFVTLSMTLWLKYFNREYTVPCVCCKCFLLSKQECVTMATIKL